MILYGQFDSPFVRRAAVALNHYGMPFERRVLSVFGNFDEMLAVNPLGKVPALQLPQGDMLYDSRAIIEYLESIAPPERRLTPGDDGPRRDMLRIEAVGIGLAEKTYERGIEFSRRAPGMQDMDWVARLERQILSALAWLEERAGGEWMVGGGLTRADLAAVMAATYLAEKLPDLFDRTRFARLDAHRARCEALPVFRASAYSANEAAATGSRPEAGKA